MAVSENTSFEKIRIKKKSADADTVFYVFLYIFLILFAIVTLYPVINLLARSFNDPFDELANTVRLLPHKWSLNNYERIVTQYVGVWRGLKITALRTLIGTILSVASTALLAFILSRRKFLFKSGLSLFWVITMYAQAGLVPTLQLYRYMHLTKSFWVYVIPGLISALYLMVIRTYMQGIPDSLEEAAQLEGAGYLRIFWSVISPLCKPVYAAIAFFVAVYHWNSWFDAMIFNRLCAEYTVLQYEMMKLYREVTVMVPGVVSHRSPTPYTMKATAYFVSILPLLIAYPFFQRYFVTGVKFNGIKD